MSLVLELLSNVIGVVRFRFDDEFRFLVFNVGCSDSFKNTHIR